MDWKKIFEGRFLALTLSVLAVLALLPSFQMLPVHQSLLAVAIFLVAVGIHDLIQTRHAILRNYPIIGHLRFFFEKIQPEMRQYFFDGDTDGRPVLAPGAQSEAFGRGKMHSYRNYIITNHNSRIQVSEFNFMGIAMDFKLIHGSANGLATISSSCLSGLQSAKA